MMFCENTVVFIPSGSVVQFYYVFDQESRHGILFLSIGAHWDILLATRPVSINNNILIYLACLPY